MQASTHESAPRILTASAPSSVGRSPRSPTSIGRVHWLGIWTLLQRHLTTFFKFWLMTIAGPALAILLYLTIFVLALGPARQIGDGASLLPFLGPGLVMLALMQRAAETSTYSMMLSKIEGSISDILMSPLTPGELTAGYGLSGMICGLLGAAPVALIILPLTGAGLASPIAALGIAALGALALSLTGTLIGVWAQKWDQVAAIFAFIIVPLAFLSGVFAPVEALPNWLASVMAFNPIFYIINGFRAAVATGFGQEVIVSVSVLSAVNLFLATVLYVVFRSGWSLRP
jgi:ABC-2 type transport system permease protein